MRFDCIERRFATLFGNYARVVCHQPWPFIVIPVLLTAILVTGFRRHTAAFLKDELDLYTPTNAPARDEHRQLDQLFHINDSDAYYATRRYDIKRAGYIIVTARSEGSDILNPLVMHAAMQLWTVVQALTIADGLDRRINYPSICVKFPMPPEIGRSIAEAFATTVGNSSNTSPTDICVSNPLVEAFKYLVLSDRALLNASLQTLSIAQITQSASIDGTTMAHLLGGVTVDSEKRIAGAKAIMLPYALRHSTAVEDWLAEKWELKLAEFLLAYDSPSIRIAWWTYETLASESARDREQLIAMLVPCFVAVTAFTVACCCVQSWIRSRPFLAIGGVISAAMAIASGVGALLLLGFHMTSVAYSMPFIVFSVGVDNVFILLSAWRNTPRTRSLPDRMSETFSDAAVSITVTSLTDVISFGVGCLTTFPSVQMFCAYAVVAVAFTYFYQLTFFAGIMVLTSRREAAGRHCITFKKMHKSPKRIAIDKYKGVAKHPAIATKYWTIEPVKEPSSTTSVDQQQAQFDDSFAKNHCLARFFRTTYADFLLNPVTRVFVLAAFLVYIGAASWGCSKIQLGLEPNDLLPDNSYGKRTLEMQEKYFSDYGSYLHVWMYNLSTLNTRHRRIWVTLEREIELYEHTEFTGYSDSWLRTFLAYANTAGLLITPDNFVYMLRNVFLSQPQYAKYTRDIVFDNTGAHLAASRIPVHLRYVGATNQSRAMNLFRRLAETSELPTGVYADFFQFAEQYNAVLPGTLSTIAIAGAAVIAVSLILIPEPIASFWVSLSIISINVGILGFMTFWSVRLDFISMVTIVMSIGICVDFSAHLAYNYAKGTSLSASDRVRNALYAVGTPILQSASSTIIGVSFMISAESYVFRSFLKTIVLVVLLGVVHGLIVLPVLLTLLHCPANAATNTTTESVDAGATTGAHRPAVQPSTTATVDWSGAGGGGKSRSSPTDSMVAARGGLSAHTSSGVGSIIPTSVYGRTPVYGLPPTPDAVYHRPRLPPDWSLIDDSGGDAYVYHNPSLTDTLR